MKKRFTFLMAAMMLLAIFAIPMGMKAAEGDVHDMNITQSTLLNNNASIPSINIAAQSYSVKTVTINWKYNKAIENPVTIEVIVGDESWGTQTITGNTTADAVFNGESTIGAITINFTNNTGSGTGHGTFYVNSVKLTEGEGGGPAPTTYTVTYHANVTGIDDIVDTYNEGSTVTIANNTFSNPGYAFTEWNTEADGNGDSYAPGDEIEDIDDDLELYAQWEESSELTLTFPLTSNPGGWPTANETTLTDYTYTLDGVNYTFALKNVKCNSGYILVTQVGVVGLPAIEGYKLTKVVASNSGGCSTSVNVGISSSASQANYIEGGAAQTWSTQGSQYTYNLTSTESNTMYYMYVTNKNAQITNLALTYEAAAAPAIATPTFDPADGATFGNEGLTVTIACETPNTVIYYTVDGSTPDNNSTLYENAIILTTTATIKAIAYDGTNYSNVATATYTYNDPNAPGTENNPYTVAEARAAIDANTGTQGVYATGIVSQIVTAYGYNGYSNITFNFVDNAGDTDFLQAYRCVSTNDADASTVAAGDVVVVYGNLTKYTNSGTGATTYEFAQGCQLVSITHPAVAVEAPTFSPEAGTYAEAQSVTISCESPSTIYYYTLDGTEPTPNSTLYSEPIPVSSTTTIKAVAYAGGDDHSTVATANYYFCSEGDPYTVTEALSFAEYQYPANSIYVTGIVSTAPESLNNGTLTYYISVDGGTSNQLEVYKGKDLNNEAFTAVDDIQVGDIVTVYGNVQVYNSTIEFGNGNYLVSFYRPEVSNITISPDRIDATAAGADGTLNITYSGLEIGDMTDFEIVYLDIDGDPIDQPNWIEVTVAAQDPQEGEGYVVSYIIGENDGDARTVYFQVFAPSLDDDFVYSNMVTVEQAEYVEPTTYTLASSIISGKTYIISNGVDRAMGAQNGTLRSAAAVSIDDNNVATVTSADVYEFVITGSAEDGYTIYDVKDEGYLYASSSSNNNIGTRDENSDGNSMWTIDFDESEVTISANGENTRKFIRYNYNNGNDRFSCYAETSSLQDPLYLFVKDEAPVVETYTRTIQGYGDNDQVKTGWYLIATPVQINIAPNTMVS
ncbi:MAG: chitobiase/beta-hexosaminidase C-terminal domain-containing protein, partial [Muribaculaceae bacterium]|nr:chitobiase/beta-hexosaminidase C-terminal domain-containing protein [Muribaculaceae bacterium]